MARPITATIHTDALRHNLGVMRARAPGRRLMAMVKADGYGHGLETAARALHEADAFGVAAIEDAARIRAAGLEQPILVLSGFDSEADLDLLRGLRAEAIVHHAAQLELLEQTDGAPIRVWLKIDTGMHRLGFPPEHVRDVHARLRAARGVHGEIVLMTHFASSDEFDPHARSGAQTPAQLRAFAAATADLPGPRSLANSAAVLGWSESHGDWIRPGGGLYGMSVVAGRPGAEFGLRPAMTFETRLLAVNPLRKGDRVGYSATWEAPEDLLLGVAAVGYGDGYPRLAPAGTPVLVNGQAASVVGRVSMDLMTIDLRGVDGVRAGDPVTLWGPALPVETVAEAAGTISYALTCGITRRVRFVNA